MTPPPFVVDLPGTGAMVAPYLERWAMHWISTRNSGFTRSLRIQ
jgi:hypothetical protein